MKLNKLFPLVMYINLDKRKDRKLLAEKEFKKAGISAQRVSGTIFNGTNNANANGSFGDLLTHVKILKYAKEQKKNVFIFEDDVKFINDYKAIIPLYCDEISQSDWDIAYLGGNILKPMYQISDHVGKLTHSQSTHSYGVKYEFIDTLLNYIPLDRIIPLDVIYAELVIPRHNCYMPIPMLTVQRDDYSDIEGQMANYESYLEQRYWANLVRKSP